MTNTITGFFVDPENNIAEPRTIDKSLEGYYALLRCDIIDIVGRVIGDEAYDIICDDEALLKENPIPSAIDWYNRPAMCGPIFVVNYDGGEDVTDLSPDDIANIRRHVGHGHLAPADERKEHTLFTCLVGLM